MKFTIEHELLNATTDNLHVAQSLLDILKQSTKFEEITTTKKDFGIKIDDVEEPTIDDISADKYLTITADDITIGGKSTTKYNGYDIWNRDMCMKYVQESSKLFFEEHGVSLLELHVVQTNNSVGNPMPDVNGKCCWLRCVFDVYGKQKTTPWVFIYDYGSAANCANFCAYRCAYYVRDYAAFRSALFSGLNN